MDIDNQRRSGNFEDRGSGGGGGGGGILGMAAFGIFRMFGIRGILIAALLLGAVYLFGGDGLRSQIFGGGAPGAAGAGQACASAAQACDFSRAILGSTEDVWKSQFEQGRLPNYGHPTTQYTDPKLVVFSNSVNTGCGEAPSSVGPFYCPEDTNLYVDPSFYQVMADRLHAPGDFAQAYVIAHEVGHHVQKLIGATDAGPQGETQNQHSVRIELQADCFAGVWGHTAQANLSIDDADLREALNAAHNIGDDALQSQAGGGVNPAQFTHGTSEQRMRWFRKGFDSGDARQCDTMQGGYDQL